MTRTLPTIGRRVLVALTAVAAVLVGLATPALASDVDLDEVSTVCVEDEPTGLQYTVRQVDRRTDPATAEVSFKRAWQGDDAYVVIDTLTLDESNDWTASGSASGLDFGDAERVTVRAVVTDSANPRVQGDTYVQTVSVADCGGGSSQGAFANFTVCDGETAAPAALLGNDSDGPLEYTVTARTGDEVFERTVTVQPGREFNRRVPLEFPALDSLEGRTIELMVVQNGAVELQRTFTVDCADDEVGSTPTATITDACTDEGGAIGVELENTTDEPVDYVITINDEASDPITVPATTTEVVALAVVDGTYDVLVEADGSPVARATDVVIDCTDDPEDPEDPEDPTADPSATATPSCAATPAIVVDLANDGDAPTTFDVTVDGELVETVTVEADSTDTVTVDTTEGDHDVVVTAGGETVLDETVTTDCDVEDTGSATTEVTCTDDGGSLVTTVVNGSEDTTVQLMVDGELVTDVDILADETLELTAPGLTDGEHDVVVVLGGETVLDTTVDVDCNEVRGETDERDGAPDADDDPEREVVVADEQLPNTGAGTVAWALAGLLLLFLGSDLVLTQLRHRFTTGTRR